jgi:ATP-dependent Lon protease
MFDKQFPGVVMGLAWTSMGGASLYIETTKVYQDRAHVCAQQDARD